MIETPDVQLTPREMMEWHRKRADEFDENAAEEVDFPLEQELSRQMAAEHREIADAIGIALRTLDRALGICITLSECPESYDAARMLAKETIKLRREREEAIR